LAFCQKANYYFNHKKFKKVENIERVIAVESINLPLLVVILPLTLLLIVGYSLIFDPNKFGLFLFILLPCIVMYFLLKKYFIQENDLSDILKKYYQLSTREKKQNRVKAIIYSIFMIITFPSGIIIVAFSMLYRLK
jgi:uncharacterized membrane protein